MALVANTPPTANDKLNLETAIADAIQVTASALKRFQVTSTLTARRLQAGQATPRSGAGSRVLATYAWAVSFAVVVVLANYQQTNPAVASPQAFQSAVTAQLGTSDFRNACARR